MLTVGSLCTGIGGLEFGLQMAGLQTHTVFVSDIDKGACAWLEANVSAPNLGDFTALDELPPVDILTVGFPCQPLSNAGQRKGIEDDRWLWNDIQRLVGRMETRPLVLLENVPGLLTSNGGHAMARVVHGLAAVGYNLTYGTMAAAAVGAPHRRNRWWGLAYSANAGSVRREPWTRPSTGKPSEFWWHGPRDDSRTAVTNAHLSRRQQQRWASPVRTQQPAAEHVCDAVRFGPYAPAVERWQNVTGYKAPNPTRDGQLSPLFTEWLMGYPPGYVTDTLTNRRHALYVLGNAVVPQCAAAAFTALAARM